MANKFKEKQYQAEILGELYETLERLEKNHTTEYRQVGVSDVQDRHWRTEELLWEDDEKTIPKMKTIWDYVPKDESELTEDDRLHIHIIYTIKAQLEKMI